MYKWILPSLLEIVAECQPPTAAYQPMKALHQWRASVAAVEQLLLNQISTSSDAIHGLVLAAPAPVFIHPILSENLQKVTFTAKPFNPLALMPFQMSATTEMVNEIAPHETVLPLLPIDPLAREQFCLVFTNKFRLVLVLGEDDNGKAAFSFSFEPLVVEQAWRAIAQRIMLTNPDLFPELEASVQKYSTAVPDYRIIMQFSQLLLMQLPEPEVSSSSSSSSACSTPHIPHHTPHTSRPDIELLQAFAHEVRTPLATIRTITKLLLKQKDLPAKVIKRLEIIDRECTEQIDRMELLFKAVELETSPPVKSTNAQLTVMSLDQVLRSSIPRWQEAANRRNLTLDFVLPQQMPTVISNPNMLDRVLTGLIENFTRSLPAGSRIQVQVIPAGDQLKLQLLPLAESTDVNAKTASPCTPPIRQAIGQLLMFQPETGTISLNLSATKHLFQAIGGKLIVRQRPRYGEVLTIFLPLEVSQVRS
ncbi:MAG: HAMP domain-containing histidine kinase [Cyanomargarita calcarea GSE-NOS-MK-12-04C]|uniref:histidine kinase n=1 Tax=Cyanomargarita calcarea GSE-NOS-MK-12-04C TaxID=2839659 RepID=A0A951QQK9_9CYAN|nr:HAMP domain-containing histidine kinase [Cyanomargarita calcarea GSE-NOS-MK-12-04C]